MTIVRKIDGAWQALRGQVVLTRQETAATLRYLDGREEPVEVGQYPVDTQPLDAGKIEVLIAEGVWGDEELTRYGLKVAEPFVAPEGKQRTGAPSYVESKGVVREVYEVEDIPPPPPEPTAEEKLAALGLTKAELRALVADEKAR